MAEKKVSSDKKPVVTAGVYDVLRRPIVSEKAVKLSEANSVAFEVDARATKEDVARAVRRTQNWIWRQIYNNNGPRQRIQNLWTLVSGRKKDRRNGIEKL